MVGRKFDWELRIVVNVPGFVDEQMVEGTPTVSESVSSTWKVGIGMRGV